MMKGTCFIGMPT